MNFQSAEEIVDRLSIVLQGENRIGGPYVALEWIGSWSLHEVVRALYLTLAWQYMDGFPASRGSEEFSQFAKLIDGTVALLQSQAFPMVELAMLDRAAKHSPEWWEASGLLTEKALARFQLGVSTVDGFTGWLKSVDPTFDDFLPMVNDHIDRHQI